MKNLLTTGLSLAALLLAGALTSCEHKELLVPESQYHSDSAGTLIINITRSAVGQTRATDISPATSLKTDEKKIQTMAVAVFRPDGTDADASKLVFYKYLDGIDGESTGFSTTMDNIYTPGGDNEILDGDKTLLFINVPQEVFTGYTTIGTSTLGEYQSLPITIDQALNDDADEDGAADNATDPTSLPMYGSATITTVSGKLTANVTVRHMIAKVTLEKLSTQFADGCSFIPQQVFLYNVAEKVQCKFTDETDVTTYMAASGLTNWYHGEASEATGLKEYLGTPFTDKDDASAETLSGTATWSKQCVLYCMPNTSEEAEANTRLVIKGWWVDTEDDTAGATRYFTFDLRNTQITDNKVYPNRNYRLKALLMREGSTTVLGKPDVVANYQFTVEAEDWDLENQSTTFEATGGTN